MKISFEAQFLDLKGYPLQVKMDDYLANVLAMATVGPPAKIMTWAVNLTNNGEIEVEKQDAEFIKNLIKTHSQIPNIFKNQLMERIDKAVG